MWVLMVLQVVMAGGRQVFFPETQSDPEYPEDSSKNGKRKDHKDLIQVRSFSFQIFLMHFITPRCSM